MKEIPLGNSDLKALVDDEDYKDVIQYNWTLCSYGDRVFSVCRTDWKNGVQTKICLHEQVFGKKEGFEIDHKDSKPLNNQKENLRYATRAQQCQNRSKIEGCYSKYKGVTFDKYRNTWLVRIRVNNKHIHLGSFKVYEEEIAAIRYDIAALHFFGEFAKLNFPENIEDYREALEEIQE